MDPSSFKVPSSITSQQTISSSTAVETDHVQQQPGIVILEMLDCPPPSEWPTILINNPDWKSRLLIDCPRLQSVKDFEVVIDDPVLDQFDYLRWAMLDIVPNPNALPLPRTRQGVAYRCKKPCTFPSSFLIPRE